MMKGIALHKFYAKDSEGWSKAKLPHNRLYGVV